MKISDTKEFNHEVLKEMSNPRINKTNEQLYERLIQVIQDEFRDIPAGIITDTLKLAIFNIIQAGMQEQVKIHDEQEREYYR